MIREHDTAKPIETQLRPALDEAGVARVWRGIRDARAGSERDPGRRRARWIAGSSVLAASGALAAAALLAYLGTRGAQPSALRIEGSVVAIGEVIAPASELALDDGSELVLDRATEMEVLANDGERFVTLLRRGRCHFAVQPGGPRRWSIETDLATVEVVGTEFTVDRGEHGLAVIVDHGVVLVRGERVPGRVRRLRAGERLDLESDAVTELAPVVGIAPAPSVEPAPATAISPTALSPTALEPTAQPERLPASAEPMVPITGTGAATTSATGPVARSAVDLDSPMAEADAARAAGNPEEAARILEGVVRESGRDPRGSIAAFSLARLQLEVLGRPDEAARTFDRVVERGSPRALVEDAQARRVEALVRAGRREEAEREAREYEARWPQGRRLAEVRAFVAE